MSEFSRDKNAYLNKVVYKSKLFDEIARNVELYEISQSSDHGCEQLIETIINIIKKSNIDD